MARRPPRAGQRAAQRRGEQAHAGIRFPGGSRPWAPGEALSLHAIPKLSTLGGSILSLQPARSWDLGHCSRDVGVHSPPLPTLGPPKKFPAQRVSQTPP